MREELEERWEQREREEGEGKEQIIRLIVMLNRIERKCGQREMMSAVSHISGMCQRIGFIRRKLILRKIKFK